jgi:hypothetical protein
MLGENHFAEQNQHGLQSNFFLGPLMELFKNMLNNRGHLNSINS